MVIKPRKHLNNIENRFNQFYSWYNNSTKHKISPEQWTINYLRITVSKRSRIEAISIQEESKYSRREKERSRTQDFILVHLFNTSSPLPTSKDFH